MNFPMSAHMFIPCWNSTAYGTQPINSNCTQRRQTLPSTPLSLCASVWREQCYIRTWGVETCVNSFSVLGLLFLLSSKGLFTQLNPVHQTQLNSTRSSLLKATLMSSGFVVVNTSTVKTRLGVKVAFGNSAYVWQAIYHGERGAVLGGSVWIDIIWVSAVWVCRRGPCCIEDIASA